MKEVSADEGPDLKAEGGSCGCRRSEVHTRVAFTQVLFRDIKRYTWGLISLFIYICLSVDGAGQMRGCAFTCIVF